MYFANYGIMLHNFDIFNPVLDLLAIPLFSIRLIRAVNTGSARQFSTKFNCPTLSLSSFQIEKGEGVKRKLSWTALILLHFKVLELFLCTEVNNKINVKQYLWISHYIQVQRWSSFSGSRQVLLMKLNYNFISYT